MTPATTIRSRVAEMHAAMPVLSPNEARSAFGREQSALAASAVPQGIAAVGTVVADAHLLDPNAGAITLYAATGGCSAVLVFYRGAWCPYCNIALSTYQSQLLPQLTERGVRLIAVSPQAPDGSLSMAEKNGLAFSVLSDSGNAIARQLGILTAPSEEARAAQLQLGLDLTTVNADATITLPMPTVAILDSDHRLRWIDVHPDYSTRTEAQEILDALDQKGLAVPGR